MEKSLTAERQGPKVMVKVTMLRWDPGPDQRTVEQQVRLRFRSFFVCVTGSRARHTTLVGGGGAGVETISRIIVKNSTSGASEGQRYHSRQQ